MKRKLITFEKCKRENKIIYRSIFTNQHSRKVYMELDIGSEKWVISECWYLDRNIGKTGCERKSAVPKLLKTRSFEGNTKALQEVLTRELDMNEPNISFAEDAGTLVLSADDYVGYRNREEKYRFLILVQSKTAEGVVWETVLKNKVHRAIYVKFEVLSDDFAYIVMCHYTDRIYKNNRRIMPETVIEGKTKIRRESIVSYFNTQFVCDFTDVLFVTPEDIKVNKKRAICGSI